MLLYALTFLAHAQDEGGLSLTPASEIDLSTSDEGSLTYEGGLAGNAPAYVRGKPVTISHSSGNVAVRCMDVEALTGRLQYTVFGSSEGPMESYGKGIGIAVWGDSKGGGAKSRVPSSKGSGVARAQIDLTVNVPKGTTSLTVTHTGSGWVQVIGCSGSVKVTAGSGGAYVGGPMSAFAVSATGNDVKVEVDGEGVLTGTSTASSPANLRVVLPSAQGGKLSVKGEEVAVQQVVMGTNTPTLVAGDMGVSGPSITLSAKKRAEVTSP
ncbi:MAG: hypothetical protein Q8P41_05060 [Pseudomonadota bacterium]|nr:hypothetical protein [Pseudomonadota bacterium]